MSPTRQSAAALRPLLEECGYKNTRLEADFKVGATTFPLVGFMTGERDIDSACIAVVDGDGQPEKAVRRCYELAAPVVWVRHNGLVDWWVQRAEQPTLHASKPLSEFEALVRQHKDKLAPASIYRGKTIARIDRTRQLDFVDVGLLPLRREEAGKNLGDLVEEMTRATLKSLRLTNPSPPRLREIFTVVFRMLSAKILKDKAIGTFADLDLSNPREVLVAVGKHYDTTGAVPSVAQAWNAALRPAAEILTGSGSFAVVSPESLAYVYEHTLVTKALRKKLGIHATPPWLVDYLVWQLYDWVREIPVQDRHVFEPGCGHAPFLLAMMRMLRFEMYEKTDSVVHTYLKEHIHGVEIDDFAREIARLSLTLADIPNPNGWDLCSGDMYGSDVLMRKAACCRILLSNPPFENFDKVELKKYDKTHRPRHRGRAVELLYRTIARLPERAVFGLVLPQNVLHSAEAKTSREILLRDFDLREICLFADKVFEEGEPESVIILGRRRAAGETSLRTVRYRRVREDGIERFARTYAPDSDEVANLEQFAAAPDASFRMADLPEVWTALHTNPRLSSAADVGQGFSFARKGLIAEARRLGSRKTVNAVPAIVDGHTHTSIWELPKFVWLSEARTPVAPWRSGNYTGRPQVLVNYVRATRGPWRIKAFLDRRGHAAINTYNTVRAKPGGAPIEFLWAILNSPVGNAYVYCNTMQKHNYDGLIGKLPLPANWREQVHPVVSAAKCYLELVVPRDEFELQPDAHTAISEALLALDAAVTRAYDLPPRLERQLLDLFAGVERKGVGCDFQGYYPPGLTAYVPLHELISPDYQRSTAGELAKRIEPVRSKAALVALDIAEGLAAGD